MRARIKLFLVEICGFKKETAEDITTTPGYDALDELCLLSDNGVNSLRSIVRKPNVGASGTVRDHIISNLAQ
jgi:hypothetical protein